jgi:predicted DNA-binding antitoxin AbrB/MazE fold protein
MRITVQAILRAGVLRPLEPLVDLEERARVKLVNAVGAQSPHPKLLRELQI